MIHNPETIWGVLSNLKLLVSNNLELFIGIPIFSFILFGIVAYLDYKTNRLTEKLRRALSENPKFERLLQQTRESLMELNCMVVDAIDLDTDTRVISPREAKTLRKMIECRAEHPLGGLLEVIGIK